MFSPYFFVCMHALKGLACCSRGNPANVHASPCSGEALALPACHACGCTGPFRACVWSMPFRVRTSTVSSTSATVHGDIAGLASVLENGIEVPVPCLKIGLVCYIEHHMNTSISHTLPLIPAPNRRGANCTRYLRSKGVKMSGKYQF